MKFTISIVSASLLFLSSITAALPAPAGNDLTVRSEGLVARAAVPAADVVAPALDARDGILSGTAQLLMDSLENLADSLLQLAKSGSAISEAMFRTLDGLVTTLVNLGVDIPAALLEKIQEIRDYIEGQ